MDDKQMAQVYTIVTDIEKFRRRDQKYVHELEELGEELGQQRRPQGVKLTRHGRWGYVQQ